MRRSDATAAVLAGRRGAMSVASFGSEIDYLLIGFEAPDRGNVYLDDVAIRFWGESVAGT